MRNLNRLALLLALVAALALFAPTVVADDEGTAQKPAVEELKEAAQLQPEDQDEDAASCAAKESPLFPNVLDRLEESTTQACPCDAAACNTYCLQFPQCILGACGRCGCVCLCT